MTTPLLTIAEAATRTGRSHSTVRRLIKTIAEAASHPDRAGIEPSLKEVDAFKKKGENFTWKIREDVLLRNFASAPTVEKKSHSDSSSGLTEDILKILRRELDLKNQQIEKQWDVIQSLNDRLREGNILMGSLQQRLAPPAAESPTPVTVDTPSMEPSIEIKRATKKKVMEAKHGVFKKDSTEAPKKGVLSWLFR
ncbi:MAG: hypothetical protein HOO67_06975 [Candidatus Peribacteraceae bacterium]|nr:hypothetical protein [Candidatus Peribacteraceae bacterium]